MNASGRRPHDGVWPGTIAAVAALNLRLSDQEMERLRVQAEREHRSMNEVVRLAVLSRIDDAERRERVLALTDQVMTERADILARLKDL